GPNVTFNAPIAYGNGPFVTVSGTADPSEVGRTVQIRKIVSNDTVYFVLESAIVASDGTWSVQINPGYARFGDPFFGGQYRIEAAVVDLAGNVSTAYQTLILDPWAPTISARLVSDTGWAGDAVTSQLLFKGHVGNGQNPAYAPDNKTVGIYDGSVLLGTAAIASNGDFAVDVLGLAGGQNLADGTHQLRFVAGDLAGNTAAADVAVTLDRVA